MFNFEIGTINIILLIDIGISRGIYIYIICSTLSLEILQYLLCTCI